MIQLVTTLYALLLTEGHERDCHSGRASLAGQPHCRLFQEGIEALQARDDCRLRGQVRRQRERWG